MNDRTLITKNYLGLVITCLESKGCDFNDFEISTERVQSYTAGQPTPYSHSLCLASELRSRNELCA